MPNTDASVLHRGTLFQGRYRVERCVKAGGMGAVYAVTDERTGAPRALKVMLPDAALDADLCARFAAEAKILGSLQSDHIVRVADAGVDGATGTPFLVMDLLHGEDLGALLARRGPVPPGEVVGILHQIALALDRMHAAGVVHRDLKPENVLMVRRDDGAHCVKIVDFGIAKIVSQTDPARTTKALGTPLYMSPEQIRGEPSLAPAADRYALGHLTYALLTGEAYWAEDKRHHGSTYALWSRILRGAAELPTARAARRCGVALPRGFDAWFLRITALAPERRHASASAAVAALSAALSVPLPARAALGDSADGATRPDAALPGTPPAPAGQPPGQEISVPPGIGDTTESASVRDAPARSARRPARRGALLAAVAACVIAAGYLALRSQAARGHPIARAAAAQRAAEAAARVPAPITVRAAVPAIAREAASVPEAVTEPAAAREAAPGTETEPAAASEAAPARAAAVRHPGAHAAPRPAAQPAPARPAPPPSPPQEYRGIY